MLNDVQLARVAISRLRIPIPTSKLLVAHSIAQALCSPSTATAFKAGFLEWIASLALESEVLEALSVFFCANDKAPISRSEVIATIRAPSILSDLYVADILGGAPIRTWSGRYSPIVPKSYDATETSKLLASGRMCPPIMLTRMSDLQKETGLPFEEHWAFEFDQLRSLNPNDDGHMSYFVAGDRQNAVVPAYSRSSLLSRSAYLRTLAYAVECWDMPEDRAVYEATYVSPFDKSLMRMVPGDQPKYADALASSFASTALDVENLIAKIQSGLKPIGADWQLVHLSAPLGANKLYRGDLEFAAAIVESGDPDLKMIFRFQDYIAGKFVLDRTENGDFLLDILEPIRCPLDESTSFCLILAPPVRNFAGYFHSDLMTRMPRFPVSCGSAQNVVAIPRHGGADINDATGKRGETTYWNAAWQPHRIAEMSARCGVATVLSRDAIEKFQMNPSKPIHIFWRLRVDSRSSEYDNWTSSELYGKLEL
jgi:hypothetical protein